MIKKCLLLLLCSSLAAETLPETGTVSSSNAAYDGNALVLKGHVVLDHGLGKMSADQASLERQEIGKDFPFSLIHLKKEVLLALKNNGELRCDTADLDFVSLKGILVSQEDDKVVYTDTFKKKDGGKNTFSVMSKVIELGLAKKGQDDKKTDYDIETVLAKKEVVIGYANDFTLLADQALFRKQPSFDGKNKEFQGIITAYPKDASSKCRLTREGDIIDADTVDLDLIQSKLSMHRPQGKIASSLIPHLQKNEMLFSSDHLVWEHAKNILTLKGHIKIEEAALGTFTADDELQLIQTVKKNVRSVTGIRSKGRTTLQYLDPESQTMRTLITHGTLSLDQNKMHAIIDSPEKQGLVPPELQIYYEEEDLAVQGDKASVEYTINENQMQPISLSIKGNVRLRSRNTEEPQRFALADRLSYSPATKTLILSANPGKKVLFWDEGQTLRISAQEVHITQDPETKKENVKGIGNVKFAFSAEEADRLTKYIPQLPLKQ